MTKFEKIMTVLIGIYIIILLATIAVVLYPKKATTEPTKVEMIIIQRE
jgi:hypothetical protein